MSERSIIRSIHDPTFKSDHTVFVETTEEGREHSLTSDLPVARRRPIEIVAALIKAMNAIKKAEGGIKLFALDATAGIQIDFATPKYALGSAALLALVREMLEAPTAEEAKTLLAL